VHLRVIVVGKKDYAKQKKGLQSKGINETNSILIALGGA
jgi:hypothetical protein